MTSKIGVLVVDDAIIVRRLIAQALAQDPVFEILDTASDGDLALERLAARMADVVTLDIDMPVKDGLQTLREIRARWPKLPVVIFTGMSEPGAAEL
jgi:two-component system chemotaxis response regulator CheB